MSAKTDRIDRLAELTAHKDEGGHGLWYEAFRRLRRNPLAMTGAVIILLFVLIAILAPWLAPYNPAAQTWLGEIEGFSGSIPGPRAENWLGVDGLGRDELSRLIIGSRQSLLVGVVATLLGFTAGAILGGLSGAFLGMFGKAGRWVDSVLMRFNDMALAVPSLLLAISVATILGQGLVTVMIAVGVTQIPVFARLLRGSMLAQSHSDYVLASTALGVRKKRIVLNHILPNSMSPVLVQATLSLATAIIEAAGLSFLGLGGANAANPEWGVMLADSQQYLATNLRLAVYPAVAIIITALGFTLLGEAMREALDPKLRK
ncbi:MAG TPA: ABC transporter permease [Phytomonospora sp.]